MGQIACVLSDAVLYERSVRIRSPRPNSLQAENIAEQYLRFGPVERALEWLTRLEDEPDPPSEEFLDLLAEVYAKLGRTDALVDVRRRIAEHSLSGERFSKYASLLSPAAREAARKLAVERAERSNDPVGAGLLLLDLGAPDRATALVLRHHEGLSSSYYEPLLALARRLEKVRLPLPAIVCYRARTDQILDRGRSTAYRHAKRYVDRSSALDRRVDAYAGFSSHAEYFARLRERHGRKFSFWKLFEDPGPRPPRRGVATRE